MRDIVNKLMAICDIESDENHVGWRKRRVAMEQLIGQYFQEVETSQSVLNPGVFNSEFMDFIKESLAKRLAEDLTTYTDYSIDNKEIKAKLLVIRPPNKGNN
jgi:hypothetical protein